MSVASLFQRGRAQVGVAAFAIRTFRNSPTYFDLLKRRGEGQATLHTWDGLAITMRRNIYDARIVTEMFGDAPYLRYARVNQGANVIDIGAYIGDFSLFMAHKFGARVVSAEPTDENRAIFESNVLRNNLSDRITVVPYAVSGGAPVALNVETNGTEVHASAYSYEGGERREVPACTLIDLLDRFDPEPVDLVKIDCEGCEFDILETMNDAVLNRIGALVFEHHSIPDSESRLDHAKGKLQDAGFRVIDEDKIVHAIRP